MANSFDLDVLRGFVAGIELGSYARAADRLGRSTSALSTQLRRLEASAGTVLLRKDGRGLALTHAGQVLFDYAKRLLALHDEAMSAVQDMGAEGAVRVGIQHDFCEDLLPRALGRFARAHPRVRLQTRVGRNAQLLRAVASGDLDFALAWGEHAPGLRKEVIAKVPMAWVGPAQPEVFPQIGSEVPLVVYEDACRFRTAAVAALDKARIPWLVSMTSPNVSGLWAGVAAGLGLSVRTPLGLPQAVCCLDRLEWKLPALPVLTLALYRRAGPVSDLQTELQQMFRDEIQRALEVSGTRDARAQRHSSGQYR